MRARPFVIMALVCAAQAIAQSGAAAETRLPATAQYQSQVSAIAFQAVIPEFAKHHERLKGSVKVTFRLDRQGRVKSLRVVSTNSNPWTQETATRMIHAANLPHIPKKDTAEQGHDWVDVEAEWNFRIWPMRI